MDYDLTEGIPLARLGDYIDTLKETLKLDEKFCKQLKTMEYANSKDKLVYEVKYEAEFESKYGYVAMVKNKVQKTISCVYAFHIMKFKLAPRRVETTKTTKFLWFRISKEIQVDHQPVQFGTNDMEAIRNTYMRFKALEALRSEGIIPSISYEP